MNYDALMDKRQARLHENFPAISFLHKKENVQKVLLWVTYYRRNLSRFVEHYFGIKLYLYQHIMLYLLAIYPNFCAVAARSSAKSYVLAIYACAKAILYPGSQIVVASASRGQARIIVSDKIEKQLKPRSPLLQAEIEKIKDSQNEIEVVFRNGSIIFVVTSNENARGHRATVMIYEECRLIPKRIIDSVLSPFLVMRQPDFLKEPEYENLTEPEVSVYITSAWYRGHWLWRDIIKPFARGMISANTHCVFALDYSIAILHKIKSREFMINERRKNDPIHWAIEYENQMVAENARAYFTYEQLAKNRRLKKAFYPRRNVDVLQRQKNKYDIAKQVGEVRIVSCDIAMEEGANNDNSIFSCIRLLPESVEYKKTDISGEHLELKRGYRKQVVYMEVVQRKETSKQAIRIKQLFEDFNADYCVLDGRYAGISVYDSLAKVLFDEERNVEYKPWRCMNDEKVAQRVQIAGAEEVVYVIKAQLQTNSEIAIEMQKALNSNMIDLLISNTEAADEIASFAPEYATASVETQLWFEAPYLETVALINEMISLEYERGEQTGNIKIINTNFRKDRYTSVSYGNYFSVMLENDLLSDNSDYEFVPLYN